MLPTINKSFLIKFTLVFLLSGGALFGAHALQARRIPDALLRQADRASAAGKTNAAIGYLRQYLEFKPQDADAMVKLAELLKTRSGDTVDLLMLYEKILRNDPTRWETRREALRLSIWFGRSTDAETHALELVKQYPNEAPLWRDLAIAQAALQKIPDSIQSFEKSITLEPGAPIGYQLLAQYYLNDWKKPDEAKAVLDRLIAALPQDPEPYITRARYALAKANESTAPADLRAVNEKNAIEDLRKSLVLDPENAEALLLLADAMQKGRDLNAAADILRSGMKAYPTEPRFVRHLAWLELNRGNLGSAVTVLEEALPRMKDGFELLVPLADLLVQMGETERTKEILAKLQARNNRPAKMQALYIRARLAMKGTQWDEAIGHLTALRGDTIDLPGLECQTNLLLSVCHNRRADTNGELESLKLLLNRDPNHLAGRVALGQAYQNSGKFEDAMQEYEKAMRSQYASSETLSSGLRMKAALLRHEGIFAGRPWDDLEKSLAEYAPKFNAATSEAVVLRAELTSLRGDRPRALAILRSETLRRPGNSRLWAALAETAGELGGVAAGLAILDEAQAISGDGADLRLARATLYANDPALLRPLEPLAAQIDTWPEGEQVRLLQGLVEIYDRLGDVQGVIKTYRRIAGRRPSDVNYWESLYERAAEAKDAAACEDVRKALAKLPSVSPRTFALLDAWDALAARNANAAASASESIVRQYGAAPDRAEACVLLAKLKAVAGDNVGAEQLFLRAAVLEPLRFAPMQEWLEYLARSNDQERLAAFVQRLARDYRWFGEPMQRALRKTAVKLEQPQAKRLLDTAAKSAEGLAGGAGQMAECYLACGLKPEALACLERAVSARTATADDWLRYALKAEHLGRSADVAMTAAKSKLAPQAYLTIAASYAQSPAAPKDWKPELATDAERRMYVQAHLALRLSRYQRNEAIELLESYVADAADQAWAKRNLAMLLAVRAEGTDRTRAKELLAGKDAAGSGENADERRSTAAILAGLSRHLEGSDRKSTLAKAVEVLAGVVRETGDRKDKFLLSQLLRASGDRARGRQLLLELIQADSKNIDYLITGLEEGTEKDDQPFAEQCAQRLMVLFPNEFAAVSAVARFEFRSGRPEKALTILNGYARQSEASPGDLQVRSARSAEVLDRLARDPAVRNTEMGRKITNSAVEKYEAVYPTRPEAVVAAAGLLAADGRSDEAFQRIERFTTVLPARVRVLAGMAAIRSGTPSPAQVARVAEWLATARNEEPESLAVLLNEGEFHSLTFDYPKAEQAFEAVLAVDPQNVVALNNLAWILAAKPGQAAKALSLVARAVKIVGLTGELLDTRARIHIGERAFEAAEQDLQNAVAMERTALRMFHTALAKDSQSPPKTEEAKAAFRTAKQLGLQERNVHPKDVPAFRAMEKW
jgi:predicted Zn-dependent protease